MEATYYKATLKELELIRENVDNRIKKLRQENGMDDFDEEFQANLNTLKKLVNDRRENEDTATLWGIFYELRGVISGILTTLSGLGDE